MCDKWVSSGALCDSHSPQSSRIRQAVLVRNPSIDYPPRSAARRSKWLVGQEVAGPATFRNAAWGKDTAQLWGQLGLAGSLTDLRIAVNLEFADAQQPLQPGDELAFLPPISGG